MLHFFLLAATTIAMACSTASVPRDEEGASFQNPVVTPVAADPSVVRAPDGDFYLFATTDNWADGEGLRIVPIFRSQSLVDWTYAGNVFDTLPDWKAEGSLWAPDISFLDGTYYLYYAYSRWADPNPCIGLATAADPTGPWTDLGRAVFCSRDVGVDNSIDAFAWYEGGARTVIWGSFHGIYAVRLNDDGTRVVGPKRLLADDRFEAPFVHRRGDYYYLFVSSGSCCEGAESTYRMYVGRSRDLTGPYVDASGRDLRDGGGTLVVAGDERWAGPGHNAVVTDDAGTDWLVYHAMPRDDARLPNGTNRRQGLIDPLQWTGEGWPYAANRAPGSREQAAPVIRQE